MPGYSDSRSDDRRHDSRRDGGRGRHDPRRGGHGRHDRDDGPRGMPLSELDPALTDLSRRVIGCAIEVHKALGPGFPREAYFNALNNALKTDGIQFTIDHDFDITFAGKSVGKVRADMFIGGRFLVKIMADQRDVRAHERTELRAQLRAADVELGLVINFGERRLKDGLVRVLNPEKLAAMRAENEGHEGDDDEYEDDDEEYEDDDEEYEDDEEN